MTSVTRPLTLHALAGADLDARSATEAIRCALNESARSGEAIYIALQTWTWKALTERRYDEELRAWHQLFEKTIAVLAATRQRQARPRSKPCATSSISRYSSASTSPSNRCFSARTSGLCFRPCGFTAWRPG